ncbi:MAG: type I-E CRISPR-associated protein Cas5/CasD [Thermodesulfobacteriota bacterium]
MDYLLFRLYGPLASWGDIAVGETRHTASCPGKSAIVGLLSAALGIKRCDTEKQLMMQQGYALAVEVNTHGTLLRDFHTAQVPDSIGNFNYRTRRDELLLGKARLGTILSSREYRIDALALVAVRASQNAPHDLKTIKKHLEKPLFHLYLGRKSCPLAAPMNPQIIEDKKNYFEAFKNYIHKPMMPTNDDSLPRHDVYWLRQSDDRHYYWEGTVSDFSDTLDLSGMLTRTRHDQPLSRIRWQFSTRQEHYFHCSGGE